MAKKYHPHILVHVTQDEKDKIDALAKKHNMSTSAFVKMQLASLLSEEQEINAPFEYEAECRDNRIEIKVSDREMDTIKTNAGGRTIAAYVRDAALNGSHVIKIDVYDNDIKELLHLLHPTVTKVHGIIDAIRVMGEVQDVQYLKLMETLNTIQRNMKMVAENVYKNRNSIRQSGLRELRRNRKIAIKNNTDVLAQFEEYEEDTGYIE